MWPLVTVSTGQFVGIFRCHLSSANRLIKDKKGNIKKLKAIDVRRTMDDDICKVF